MDVVLAAVMPTAGPIQRAVRSLSPQKFVIVSNPTVSPEDECFICLDAYLAHDNTSPEGCRAIQLKPCNHLIGDVCFEAWITSAANNGGARCPACTQKLQTAGSRARTIFLSLVIIVGHALLIFGFLDGGLELLIARHARVVRHTGLARVFQASFGLMIVAEYMYMLVRNLVDESSMVYLVVLRLVWLLTCWNVVLLWRVGEQQFLWY